MRVSLDNIVNFQAFSLDPQGKNLALEGKIKNVSLSGIYFEIEESCLFKVSSYLKVSNIIWMEFSLPGKNSPIRTQGEIRRVWKQDSGGLGLGVMFINIPQDGYKSLNRFLDSALEGKKEI